MVRGHRSRHVGARVERDRDERHRDEQQGTTHHGGHPVGWLGARTFCSRVESSEGRHGAWRATTSVFRLLCTPLFLKTPALSRSCMWPLDCPPLRWGASAPSSRLTTN